MRSWSHVLTPSCTAATRTTYSTRSRGSLGALSQRPRGADQAERPARAWTAVPFENPFNLCDHRRRLDPAPVVGQAVAESVAGRGLRTIAEEWVLPPAPDWRCRHRVCAAAGAGAAPIGGGAPTAEQRPGASRGDVALHLLAGLALVLPAYALTAGWGVAHMPSYARSPDPGLIVYRRYLGTAGWALLVLFTVDSYLTYMVAKVNAVTRIWLSAGRDGILFRPLARVHPRFHASHLLVAFLFAVVVVVPSSVFPLPAAPIGSAVLVAPAWLLAGFGVTYRYARRHPDLLRLGLSRG